VGEAEGESGRGAVNGALEDYLPVRQEIIRDVEFAPVLVPLDGLVLGGRLLVRPEDIHGARKVRVQRGHGIEIGKALNERTLIAPRPGRARPRADSV